MGNKVMWDFGFRIADLEARNHSRLTDAQCGFTMSGY
jgi:hypothetical protein